MVLESLQHCQKEKGLVVYGWCIMSNHAHLIISANENNVSDVLGDFKKFTSKKIIKAIENIPEKAAKNGCLKYLKKPEKRIAEIQTINFGSKTINLK
jgi:REP element-mobilizing transposase RayT